MVGFLKKKKKDGDASEKAPAGADKKGKKSGKKGAEPSQADASDTSEKSGKKGGRLKKIIFIVLILAALGGAGFFVYTMYFAGPAPGTREYKPAALEHVNLPPEMLKFSFDMFPDLYDALVVYNAEVILFDNEIARINAIATQYPEQKKIADSQIKIWDKGKSTLLKEFKKFEKPIKETYVLYRVNQAQGQAQVDAKSAELSDAAQAALKTAQEMTQELKDRAPKVPEGMIKGTVYKIKKIFS